MMVRTPSALQRPDIAPVVDLAREQVMMQPVAGEKRDPLPLQYAEHDG